MPITPFGIACRILARDRHQCAFPKLRSKHATDTLRLLLENGLDTQASVETDHNLTYLGEGVSGYEAPHSIKRVIAQQFSWLMRNYIQATTCDGLLSCTALSPATCEAIRHSSICYTNRDEFWEKERAGCELLTHSDTQAFQPLWLSIIAAAAVYGDLICNISPEFCKSYAGNFDYEQSWSMNDHTGRDRPMQLALRGFAAVGTFHSILVASGTDIVRFTELECMMPWCDYTQEALMSFFSLPPERYLEFAALISAPKMCYFCYKEFQHEGLMTWEETIQSVKSGRSLASLLEYPSKAEESRLNFLMRHCEDCRSEVYTSSESDDSEDDQTEDSDDERIGFIESEIGDDEDFLSDIRVSQVEHEQMEYDAGVGSSDESLSDEDLGGEQIGWDYSCV